MGISPSSLVTYCNGHEESATNVICRKIIHSVSCAFDNLAVLIPLVSNGVCIKRRLEFIALGRHKRRIKLK